MKIAILGGGISGLSAAWRLSRLYPNDEIILFEKSNRLGGWIETAQEDGFLFEKGPRTFSVSRSPQLLQLIQEVGLENELLFSTPRASKRYLWRRGSLRSLGRVLAPHLWRLLLEPWIAKGSGEETIDAFAKRRFGKKIAELLFDPMTLGIFGGDSRALSLQACLPRFAAWEESFGSVLKGLWKAPKQPKRFPGSLFTLKRGMQSLIEAMQQKLSLDLRLETEVLGLERQEALWRIETSEGCFEADAVFSALPALALGRLLPEMPSIPHASLSIANIGYRNLSFPHKGYGYLVPSSEQEPLLGMIWDSEVFPDQEGNVRLTAMIRPQADPLSSLQEALTHHLNLSEKPDIVEIFQAKEAIPQFFLGHRQRIAEWEKTFTNLYLLGNYIDGVSVEHCVARAARLTNDFYQKMIAN